MTEMRWYSVKKYKPYIGMECFVTNGESIFCAKMDNYGCWEDTIDCHTLHCVTHFAIPAPIKIEE